MQNEHLVPADQFCIQHNAELSFITLLCENGLIEMTTIEETHYLSEDSLPDLERMIRLNYELDINLEGIEAITHLLQRVQSLQTELNTVRRKLRLYETD